MSMRRSLAVLSGLLLLVGGAAAFPVKDHAKVEINDTGFNPARMEVKAGEKIVWTNMSQKEHTVTSTDKLAKNSPESNQEAKPLFDSGPLKGGGTWERVFDQPGTFEYFCQMDKTMKGTIVVRKAE
jgi:plastocyanin